MTSRSVARRFAFVLVLAPLAPLAGAPTACGGATASSAAPGDAGVDGAFHPGPDAAAAEAAPAPEASPEAAPQPLASALLLFSGDGPDFFTDTWEWDGSIWAQRNVTGPPGRYDHATAALHGKIVLFGGSGTGGYLGDTWEWDGLAWTKKDIPGPSPRGGHRMATNGDKIVLFGGSGDAGDDCDTWEYDGSAWTQTSATLTVGLHCFGHGIAALGGKVYLFGGVGAESDTWAYDGTAWTKVSTTGPVGRSFTSMATLGSEIILFGGEVDANHIVNDTWTWNGTAWTQQSLASAPSPRWHAGFAAFQNAVLLFGGDGGSGAGWLGDTWLYDGTKWLEWKGDGPSARYTYTLASR